MPSNTIPVKWLQDKNGNEFYPVTHKGAIRDDNGNPISVPEELNDLSDVAITPVVDNTQTYFENAVQDYDGNWYDAVILGDQVWMAENLKTTHYADGTAITQGTTSTTSLSTSYYAYPYNDESYVETRGLLYNGYAVTLGSTSTSSPSNVKGIAPTGWHVPSKAEYLQLVNYLKSDAKYWADGQTNTYIAKAMASTNYWDSSNIAYSVGNDLSKNNASKFNLVPTYQTEQVTSLAICNNLNAYFDFMHNSYATNFSTNYVDSSGNTNKTVRCVFDGSVAQFRQAMATKPSAGQILKYDGNHWVNTEIDHNFTFDSETVSTSSATVTFGASQRGTHFIAAQNDLSITFNVNNESDNYLWIYNTGNSAIQIYIQDVTHNGSQVQYIYMPEDDIIIQPGYAGEIGIVHNNAGAFITTRCDLRYTYNNPSV